VTASPTIAAQIERMQALYPAFRVESCDWAAIWTGELRPIRRPYTIQVSYVRRYWIGELEAEYGYIPCVRLLAPELVPRHPDTGAWAEHLYWYPPQPTRSRLCLYDPAARPRQWTRQDFIAERVIPWSAEWLACYEIWLATGEWKGGGRHPAPRRSACQEQTQTAAAANPGRRESRQRDEFHWIGRRIGTSVSWPLMAAASAASSLPMCWPRWNSVTWEEGPLPSFSTSSLAPPPEASSRSGSELAWPPAIFETSIATEAERFFQRAA